MRFCLINGKRREDGISPVIATILLVALTIILVSIVGAAVMEFGNVMTQSKEVSLTMKTTGNAASPIEINVWGGKDLAELKEIYVCVAAPADTKIGTPDQAWTVFTPGQMIQIPFNENIAEGNYLVTLKGVFADGTEQVLVSQNMRLKATGIGLVEVSDKVSLAISAKPHSYTSRNITIYDKTYDYKEKENILYWKLEYGDGNLDIFTSNQNIYDYKYAPEAFEGKTYKEFTITYTVVYNDKTKTTVTTSVNAYNGSKLEEDPASLEYYLSPYKLEGWGGKLLLGDIDLRGVLSETMWKSNINAPYIQININRQTSTKKGGASVDSWIFETNGNSYSNNGYGYANGIWIENVSIYKIAFNNDTIPNPLTITIKLINNSGIVLPNQTTKIYFRDGS